MWEDHTSVRHPHLFEISAWPWLERLSATEGRAVTLADIPAREWDAIAARGFGMLFLMGVWKRSSLGRALALADDALRAEYDAALPGWTPDDVPGSPYCIAAYEPDARMGGWQGLDTARAQLNARGVKLLLDFVPNHTALDHPWTSEYPERYVLGTDDDARNAPLDFHRVGNANVACGRDPFFPPWRDVAQLNYFNPDTRRAMAEELRAIGAHCDGVRCDMAMLVLNHVFERTWRWLLRDRWPRLDEEFWPAAIESSPELVFLAEVYWDLEWTLQQQGFHFTYDKRLLDRLRDSTPEDVRGHLSADPAFNVRLARFLENHDEARSAVSLTHRLPAAAALFATLPGVRFYFDGQLEGRKRRTPVQLGRWAEEPVDARLRQMYERILAATTAPMFHEGDWKLLDVTSAGDGTFTNLVAYRWRHAGEVALVVANLGLEVSTGHVPIVADLRRAGEFDLTDAVSGATYRRTRKAMDVLGLYVKLDPGGAHVFTVVGSEG